MSKILLLLTLVLLALQTVAIKLSHLKAVSIFYSYEEA